MFEVQVSPNKTLHFMTTYIYILMFKVQVSPKKIYDTFYFNELMLSIKHTNFQIWKYR